LDDHGRILVRKLRGPEREIFYKCSGIKAYDFFCVLSDLSGEKFWLCEEHTRGGPMKEYDIVVIGSGAGANLINDALEHGKTVALVDKGPAGGTCLNSG
jgi:hypothetical protein